MKAASNEPKRAETYEEIKPLVDLCKAGKLFAVQDWLKAGRPVNVPQDNRRGETPLEVAMRIGFHSLVQVLLDGGAKLEPERFPSPMFRALDARRFDIVKLLVEHGGYDPAKADMKEVFDSWDPEIMEYFIERGAEMEKGNPLAYALSSRIRTALRIYKKYRDTFPSFKEQATIALRHHCAKGNLKWVSLMLWAGADPYVPGLGEYDSDPDDDQLSALGYAALHGHAEIFKLKSIKLDSSHSVMKEVLRYAHWDESGRLVQHLIDLGVNFNDDDNGGSSAIKGLLLTLGWLPFERRNIDSNETREKMKVIHLLAKAGAKWVPKDKQLIADVRKSFLRLIPDYAVEFVWIMTHYKACAVEDLKELLKTPTIKAHIRQHAKRMEEILSEWDSSP